ncbi:deoxyribodipyrimidine photo-lyase [Devosia sp. YR412]|uniref:cryptochrome/photolyase family protein n=1 Tax=Devosia sp. YR412 TaxID=1881030 RepID=UPI0008AD3161|nr:deoxyribodipyrimidine photo-lyase [Devosia sp. YR412]SEQ58173.1 deoxyribodipyrimidine photo-lyase [Devosia sp. YR412]
MAQTSIVWLRNDLRIADNPALRAAHLGGAPVTAVYIHETTKGVRPPGAAARWWLHHSLNALGKDLAKRGVTLVVRSGDAQKVVPELAKELAAGEVFWNRRYAPAERDADTAIKHDLRQRGFGAQSCPGNVLVEPWDIATGQGKPYSVFTPFWKTLKDTPIARPQRRPDADEPLRAGRFDEDYRAPKWAGKLGQHWSIGEEAAAKQVSDFLDGRLDDYAEGRDFPRKDVTSLLSPHLRFGEVSPRQVWHAAQAVAHADLGKQAAVEKFLSELAWRDFNYHQLYHRDDITTVPMQGKYAGMEWLSSEKDLKAWQTGQTGLPIVDAGMRELWETGYMQNRVRMLVASLLAKNLLVDWRLGEQWFWDCLVDGDVASNPGNWQWVAGSGLDASPYFRIFNPVVQGERFDGGGDYVRRWVPELAKLPEKWIHEPSAAPKDVLDKAGVVIGRNYPAPIVDLKTSRVRALEAAGRL